METLYIHLEGAICRGSARHSRAVEPSLKVLGYSFTQICTGFQLYGWPLTFNSDLIYAGICLKFRGKVPEIHSGLLDDCP